MTASLLKSPRLFSVFCSISTMLLLGWSLLVLLSPCLPLPLLILLWQYWARQLRLVSPSLSCFMFFSVFYQGLSNCIYFCFFQFYHVASRKSPVHYSVGSLLLLTITRSGRLAEMRCSVWMSKSQRILCISVSRTDFRLCIYHLFIWSNLVFL